MKTHYQSIKQHVEDIAVQCGRDPLEIAIIAVSKNHPVESIQAAANEGCRDFGENRVQEALSKIPHLSSDLTWHFIGTLQSNKINKMIPHFQLIHSVDSVSLAKQISQACQRLGTEANLLLQVNTSGETSKHGLTEEEWRKNLDSVLDLPSIHLLGLMTMAPFIKDSGTIRHCFKKLRLLREEFQGRMKDPFLFKHLSMGMSHDYPLAIEEGATLLRIGTAIFGNRLL